jgi:hypothetical protein
LIDWPWHRPASAGQVIIEAGFLTSAQEFEPAELSFGHLHRMKMRCSAVAEANTFMKRDKR